MKAPLRYDLLAWINGPTGPAPIDEEDQHIGLTAQELRDVVSVSEFPERDLRETYDGQRVLYDLVVWRAGEDGPIHIEEHGGMLLAELRATVASIEGEPAPVIVTGDEAVFLLAMRRSWAVGDGRADAVMEILRACRDNMRVVPRVAMGGVS